MPYALRRISDLPLYWVALTAVIVIDGAPERGPGSSRSTTCCSTTWCPGARGRCSVAWTLTLEMLFYIVVPSWRRSWRGTGPVAPERLAALVLASWAASMAFTIVSDLQGDGQTGLWLRGSAVDVADVLPRDFARDRATSARAVAPGGRAAGGAGCDRAPGGGLRGRGGAGGGRPAAVRRRALSAAARCEPPAVRDRLRVAAGGGDPRSPVARAALLELGGADLVRHLSAPSGPRRASLAETTWRRWGTTRLGRSS